MWGCRGTCLLKWELVMTLLYCWLNLNWSAQSICCIFTSFYQLASHQLLGHRLPMGISNKALPLLKRSYPHRETAHKVNNWQLLGNPKVILVTNPFTSTSLFGHSFLEFKAHLNFVFVFYPLQSINEVGICSWCMLKNRSVLCLKAELVFTDNVKMERGSAVYSLYQLTQLSDLIVCGDNVECLGFRYNKIVIKTLRNPVGHENVHMYTISLHLSIIAIHGNHLHW